jgi:hypothetical protein
MSILTNVGAFTFEKEYYSLNYDDNTGKGILLPEL